MPTIQRSALVEHSAARMFALVNDIAAYPRRFDWCESAQVLEADDAHVVADAHRTRKLLLHKREIELLIGRVQRDGYTLVPTALYWKGNKVKAEVALAKGKQTHDKREASKERDWNREKQRLLRRHNKDA